MPVGQSLELSSDKVNFYLTDMLDHFTDTIFGPYRRELFLQRYGEKQS
jgi:hypothetical protein